MSNTNTVNARPTKDFFIQMLTRDITLEKSILDLLDNSADSARKIRPTQKFEELFIKINVSKDLFLVEDNCGGFSLEIAKNYAFVFGKPQSYQDFGKGAIGRFGVGMKRSLFKIGKKIKVESKHQSDHFIVLIDVENWLNIDEWNFPFIQKTSDNEEQFRLDKDGVLIEVSELHENVSNSFSETLFINNLMDETKKALSYYIDRKLSIQVNDNKLKPFDLFLTTAEDLKPLLIKFEYNNVNVKVFAGIDFPNPEKAGWYIYCNDRLVLEKDKSNLTGWREEKSDDDDGVRKFHNQHAMFRGIVFFDADDVRNLPLTTTKIGIDADSKIYKYTRQKMQNALKQITVFLNKIKSIEERREIVEQREKVHIRNLKSHHYSETFIIPEEYRTTRRSNNPFSTISYKKEKVIINKMKKILGVSSAREVGEATFDYYTFMEEIDL